MEVVSISEVIIDGKRVKHSGVLVMLRERYKVNLYLHCVNDNNKFKTVDYDVSDDENVKFFYCRQESCVGFVSLEKHPGKTKSTIIHVVNNESTKKELDYLLAVHY